jgi:hypothetical protein
MVTKIAVSSSHSCRSGASFSALTTRDSTSSSSRRFDSLLAHQLARYLAGYSIYVAVTQHASFFDLAKRIAAFRNELIRSASRLAHGYLAAFPSMSLYPSRSVQLCFVRETLLDNWHRLKLPSEATVSQAQRKSGESRSRR